MSCSSRSSCMRVCALGSQSPMYVTMRCASSYSRASRHSASAHTALYAQHSYSTRNVSAHVLFWRTPILRVWRRGVSSGAVISIIESVVTTDVTKWQSGKRASSRATVHMTNSAGKPARIACACSCFTTSGMRAASCWRLSPMSVRSSATKPSHRFASLRARPQSTSSDLRTTSSLPSLMHLSTSRLSGPIMASHTSGFVSCTSAIQLRAVRRTDVVSSASRR
mmetsp:Transcript_41325/g.127691  ORF Transcript_41325/g.127691 Transcript_41325/m.127691 type:complete len:223 (-) Transcript_41325:1242-1910(-)